MRAIDLRPRTFRRIGSAQTYSLRFFVLGFCSEAHNDRLPIHP